MLEEDSLLEKKRYRSEMVATDDCDIDSADEEFPERDPSEPALAILCVCREFPAANLRPFGRNNLVVDIIIIAY